MLMINSLANWATSGAKRGNPILDTEKQISKDSPVPVVYGFKKVAGQIIYREDTLDPTFNMAVALCEGEIEEISNVQVNGRDIYEIGESKATIYYGTATQAADPGFTDGSATIPCEADCYIWDGAKDTNYNTDLLMVSYHVNGERRTYLRFSFNNTLPPMFNLRRAQVRLQKTETLRASKKSVVGYGVASESWSETTLTWNNAPARGEKFINSTLVSPGGSWVDLVLNPAGLAALKAAYAAGTSLSIEISQDDEEVWSFESKETPYVPPSLILHYTGATVNAFRNTAYIALTIDNRDGLAGGNYPEVTAYVKGCKVRAWSGTAWGTAAYSQNPAWVIYDMLAHPRRGMGAAFDSSLLDAASFKAVADYCDELVERPDGATEPRHAVDIAYASKTDGWKAIQEIRAATGIYFQEHDGKIYLAIEQNGTADHVLVEADFIPGSFSYSVSDPYDVPNVLRVSYTEPAEDFKEVYVQAESGSDVADFGMKISEIRLSAVNRKSEALRFAHWQLWRGLQVRRTFTGRLSINNADMIAGDIAAITHALPAWSGKLFRIVDVREDANDELEISGQEYLERSAVLETNLPNSAYVETTGGSGQITITGTPDAPTWTLTGVQGGWKFTITGPVAGAKSYSIYQFDEDSQRYANPAGSITDGRSATAQAANRLTYTLDSHAPTARTWGKFVLYAWVGNKRSEASAGQGAWSRPQNAADFVPTAPSLSTDGYPVLSRTGKYNAWTFTIRNMLLIYGAEKDMVQRYDIQRRDDRGSDGMIWGGWQVLPSVNVDTTLPAPLKILYDNTDHNFIPGWIYQYQVRAVGLNEKVSDWSTAINCTLADDTTPPDKPVFTATEGTGFVRLDIQAATQSAAACPDFAFWKIEKSDNAGSSWQTLQEQWRTTTFVDVDIDANLESNRRYRITAYDYSGNASTVSDSSSDKKKKKVDTTALADGAITGVKATIDLQSWQLTTVWSSADYRTVNWAAGALLTGGGNSYSIGAGGTGNMTAGYEHFIYFDLAVSTTALQVTTTAANACGSGKILLGVCFPNSDTSGKASFQMFGGVGKALHIVTADWLAAGCVTADKIVANTITAAQIASGTITTTQLNFTPGNVMSGSIVATINASAEGISIDAAKVNITGSTDFIAAKLTKVGGSYDSAASGARVRIFPDANTAIQIIDDAGADVFKALVGGTDVGDVQIGSLTGYYQLFDKSTGELVSNMTITSMLGSGLNDDEGVQMGRLGSGGRGEFQVVSGLDVCGKLGGNGVYPSTQQGAARLWLKNTWSGSAHNKTTEVQIEAQTSFWKYDGSVVLQINNDAAYGLGTADFANIQIDAGRGVNVTGTDGMGRYLSVMGNQVVGERGTAVADATGAGDVVAQLNALLARCRTHGLIAT